MAVMRNTHSQLQPPGPTIAKIFGEHGIPTPKIKKIRTTGQYIAEWYQKGMLDEVPPASKFKSQIETTFDGIKIVKLQNTHAYWRQGNPIIIATVFFDIIDFMRPKSLQSQNTPSRDEIHLVRIDATIITSLLETIQRGPLALPFPQQPIALLPASTPARTENALAIPSIDMCPSSTLIVNPASPFPDASGKGSGDGVGSAFAYIAKNGAQAFVNQLKAEAAEAGREAQRHYRVVNPPATFDTLNEINQQTITLTDQS